MADSAIAPTTWSRRDSLIENMANPDASAKFGGTSCGLLLWNEGCAGLGFGFEAEPGTYALMLGGMAVLAVVARRRRHA